MSSTVLLTGCTGHLGTGLIQALLADEETRVLALVRARDEEHLQRRMKTLCKHAKQDPEVLLGKRLFGLRGDTTEARLGLSVADLDRWMPQITDLVHTAARVQFNQTRKEASRNIDGARQVLALAHELAEGGQLRRLDHVSTAFVCGRRRGRILESELSNSAGFFNSYEWSKQRAELLMVEAQKQGLPVCIARPSIVVGESVGGKTRSFNVIYWPLKVYARGLWRWIPGSPEGRIDIVPVDYVVRMLMELRQRDESTGGCFHLAAGDAAPTIGELAGLVQERLEGPPIRYISHRLFRVLRFALLPMVLTPKGRSLRRGGEAFLPYFQGTPTFDNRALVQLLGGQAQAPSVLDYFGSILDFALEADFGQRRGA